MVVTTIPTVPNPRLAAVPDESAIPEHADVDVVASANAAEGFGLSDDQLRQLAAYRDLVLDWNQRFNLTAVKDPAEVDRRLVLDALRLLPALDRAIAGIAQPRLVDVGSGAGFPGLVLRIARPDLGVTLLDATGKKVRFLDHAATELGLDHVAAVHGRAEELARDWSHRGQYDLATARAVAALPTLLEYVVPFLRVGGLALLPKGLDIDAELASAQEAARLLHARIVSADALAGGTTRLVVVEKTRPTADAFPRRAGLPSQEPLGSKPLSRARPSTSSRGPRGGAERGTGASR